MSSLDFEEGDYFYRSLRLEGNRLILSAFDISCSCGETRGHWKLPSVPAGLKEKVDKLSEMEESFQNMFKEIFGEVDAYYASLRERKDV